MKNEVKNLFQEHFDDYQLPIDQQKLLDGISEKRKKKRRRTLLLLFPWLGFLASIFFATIQWNPLHSNENRTLNLGIASLNDVHVSMNVDDKVDHVAEYESLPLVKEETFETTQSQTADGKEEHFTTINEVSKTPSKTILRLSVNDQVHESVTSTEKFLDEPSDQSVFKQSSSARKEIELSMPPLVENLDAVVTLPRMTDRLIHEDKRAKDVLHFGRFHPPLEPDRKIRFEFFAGYLTGSVEDLDDDSDLSTQRESAFHQFESRQAMVLISKTIFNKIMISSGLTYTENRQQFSWSGQYWVDAEGNFVSDEFTAGIINQGALYQRDREVLKLQRRNMLDIPIVIQYAHKIDRFEIKTFANLSFNVWNQINGFNLDENAIPRNLSNYPQKIKPSFGGGMDVSFALHDRMYLSARFLVQTRKIDYGFAREQISNVGAQLGVQVFPFSK